MDNMFSFIPPKYRKNKEDGTFRCLPKKGTKGAAAYDIYCPVHVDIPAHKSVMVWTDVKVYIESGYVFLLTVRSSMGKKGIMLANTIGVIDQDYADNPDNDGNIGVFLHNYSDKDVSFEPGDRIAQGLFVRIGEAVNGQSDDQRVGGFGSSGK